MKTKTEMKTRSAHHRTLSCKLCGSREIKMQPIAQNLWVLWCEACSRSNRVEKTVAFATREDLNDAL